MADAESEIDKKRKRSDKSSISDIETENNNNEDNKTEKTKKKKKKITPVVMAKLPESDTDMDDGDVELTLAEQLKEINSKLSNFITRDDDSLKQLIKDTFKQMKEEFLKSVSHRIDLLEGRLFDKEIENDQLKKQIETLEQDNEQNKEDNAKKITEVEAENLELHEQLNELEQYGRRNSIRIVGIPEAVNETSEETAKIASEALSHHMPDVTLRRNDIDIAHRLGKKDGGYKPRAIIMKFVSRMTRENVFRGRKALKGTNIYVNEDLTWINHHILACVRKKQSDEVESAWTKNGHIYYKHHDKSVHEVKYEDYSHWKSLKWPKEKSVIDTEKKDK